MTKLDFERRIKRPIIVLGAGRSGTGMVGKLLGFHDQVAYYGEPRPIWMHGNAYRKDHALDASHLSPRIAHFIDDHFAEFLEKSGKARFAEKTPSNCLRVPFIRALYPDAQFIHVVRDGRDVVRGTLKIRVHAPQKGAIRERMATTPIRDWPSYIPMFFRTYWRAKVAKKPASHWGANPPGWREWLRLPPHIAACKQWTALVDEVLKQAASLPKENYLELRYEEVSSNPKAAIEELLDFTGLPESAEMLAFADERIDKNRFAKWRTSLDEERDQEIDRLLRPTLDRLGYS